MKKVTIIIPNYNGEVFLPACLDGLRAQEGADFDTLVVENGSQDSSREVLARYPEVRVLQMEENLGFAGGVNADIRAADTPYVLLLNNDTRPFPGFVRELLAAIEKSESIFSVSAQMLRMDRPDLLDDAGDGYCALGWAFQHGTARPAEEYAAPRRVFSACAGAAIYRRDLLEKTGLFDEAHFAYLEDIDLGFRGRLLGCQNLYAPRAKVLHVGSGTSGSKYNSFKVRLAARNSVYVAHKNLAPWQKVLNAPALALGHLVKLVFFARRGFAKDYFAGLKEGILTCGTLKTVDFADVPFARQLSLEAWLLGDTVRYAVQVFVRKLNPKM
ncbi:MAG: glycosyltransferase family 2 protein [Lachnospiraceae bacterium]|nr:glycosyltransferase family 2 protein [Lachnospiraceae bacterium]